MKNKIILTDADGVLLDWEYAFDVYLRTHGFNKVEGGNLKYDIGKRYGIDREQGKKLIKIFNESAHIGFLPPLRDAMYYVKRLHEEHGYVFHCITSLSNDINAQRLQAGQSLASLGQGGLGQAIGAAGQGVTAAMTPQDYFNKYLAGPYGAPSASYGLGPYGSSSSTSQSNFGIKI